MDGHRMVFMDVTVNVLLLVIPVLPSAVTIVGSGESEREGIVRLMLRGPFPGYAPIWSVNVTDDGLGRSVTMHSL
jgi:hypothetical protein